MISIRAESPDDHEAIGRLTVDAFTHSEFGYHGEAKLIEKLRATCSDWLSLIACSDETVVGHILFTPVIIRTTADEIHGVGLGPMSVAPTFQRRGIGSMLVRSGMKLLQPGNSSFVVVLGHPEFYPRFGFRAANEFGIQHGFAGISQDVFFVRFFEAGCRDACHNGRAFYSSEFGAQHAQDKTTR